MINFEKVRSLVDDLRKLRDAKICQMIKNLTPTENTIDMSALTEMEINFYRHTIGDSMRMYKRIQGVVGVMEPTQGR